MLIHESGRFGNHDRGDCIFNNAGNFGLKHPDCCIGVGGKNVACTLATAYR